MAALPLRPDVPDHGDLERVDREIRRFEQACRLGDDLALARYWATRAQTESLNAEEELLCLGGLIKADLRRRFERGETPAVANYLEEFPRLATADSRVISLIYEEYCLREERGDQPNVESFCDRYPDWRDSIASQLRYHHLLSRAVGLPSAPPRFPEAGDRFEEFDLRTQIGRGGYSRVFLADDRSLGGKRVVLKVSVDRGREAETQGALDHPHIVPVNAVVFHPDGQLRGLSMPHRPGLPLDEVARALRRDGAAPRSARAVWDCLVEGIAPGLADQRDEGLAAALRDGPRSDGWRGFPVDGSYARGVAWIGMVLARALDYAHRRKTYHRDVKPGNVLLTVQHGPQLLDFNLAESPHSSQEAETALRGGTLEYMAPEQIEAFLNPDLWGKVGALADLYSLGLVLRELLTGLSPERPNPDLPPPRAMNELLDHRKGLSTDLRRHDRRIPHALEAIVKKCLALKPTDRYANAALLANDLENFLEYRPPQYAENPSRAERLTNWARRNRRILAVNIGWLCVVGALAPYLAGPIAKWFQPAIQDRPEFRRAVANVDAGEYELATPALLKLVEEYPASGLPRFYLSVALARVDRLTEDPAQGYYASAMKTPGSEAELRDWLRDHPRLGDHLRWFGGRILEKVSGLAGRPASKAREEAANRIFGMAAHASGHALIVDPHSAAAIQQLATIAEYQGDYEAATRHLSTLLDSAEKTAEGARVNEIFAWRLQRSRVTLLRIKELARSPRAEDQGRASALADQALADADFGDGFASDNLRRTHLGLKAEALLTRAEVRHLRRGGAASGEADYQEAKTAVEGWISLSRAAGSPVLPDYEAQYRARLLALREAIDDDARR